MSDISLSECTQKVIDQYFDDLGEISHIENLYQYVIEEVEKPLIQSVLKATNGNKLKAAKILGVSRNTLNKKIKYFSL